MNFMNTDAQLRLAFFAFQVEAYKAESDSDQIVTDYLDKKIESTDEFLDKYLALRKVMYLRRVKLDKMSELIQNPQNDTKIHSGDFWNHFRRA